MKIQEEEYKIYRYNKIEKDYCANFEKIFLILLLKNKYFFVVK